MYRPTMLEPHRHLTSAVEKTMLPTVVGGYLQEFIRFGLMSSAARSIAYVVREQSSVMVL